MDLYTKICPYCREDIPADASKCKYCGEWLDTNSPLPSSIDELETMDEPVQSIDASEKIAQPYRNTEAPKHGNQKKGLIYKPLRIQQNYSTGKTLSIILIVLVVALYILTNFLDIFGHAENIISQTLFAVSSVLMIRLMLIVERYMHNFGVSANLMNDLKCFAVSLGIFTICLPIMDFADPESTLYSIFSLLGFLSMGGIYITFILAGKCIYNLRSKDFAGGVTALGGVMFFGFLFPFIWAFVPVFTYQLFNNADNYVKIYGFEDTETD